MTQWLVSAALQLSGSRQNRFYLGAVAVHLHCFLFPQKITFCDVFAFCKGRPFLGTAAAHLHCLLFHPKQRNGVISVFFFT